MTRSDGRGQHSHRHHNLVDTDRKLTLAEQTRPVLSILEGRRALRVEGANGAAVQGGMSRGKVEKARFRSMKTTQHEQKKATRRDESDGLRVSVQINIGPSTVTSSPATAVSGDAIGTGGHVMVKRDSRGSCRVAYGTIPAIQASWSN